MAAPNRRRGVVSLTLAPTIVAAVDSYAEASRLTRSRAVERLLLRALRGSGGAVVKELARDVDPVALAVGRATSLEDEDVTGPAVLAPPAPESKSRMFHSASGECYVKPCPDCGPHEDVT